MLMKNQIKFVLLTVLFVTVTACEEEQTSNGDLRYTGKSGTASLDSENISQISNQICRTSQDSGTSIKTIIESLKDKIPLSQSNGCIGNTGSVSTTNGIVFDHHCVVVDGHDVTIDGEIHGAVDLQIDPAGLAIEGSVEQLSVQSGNFVNILFDGNMRFAVTPIGGNFDLDLLIKEQITGKVFKYTNLHFAYNALDNSLFFSGTLSLPQFGEVDIETTQDLVLGDKGIESGRMVINKDVIGSPMAIIDFDNGNVTVQGSIEPINLSCL